MNNVFVIDHMCALPIGHNLNSVIVFMNEFKKQFDRCYALVSTSLPDWVEEVDLVDRCLYYPYGGLITGRIDDYPASYDYFANLYLNAKRRLLRAFYKKISRDHIYLKLLSNWRYIFLKYQIDSRDLLFFPSADYYGAISLIKFIRKLPPAKHPKVHLRFIGWSEFQKYWKNEDSIFSIIKSCEDLRPQLSFSAETPRYAKLIESFLDEKIIYLPYPLCNKLTPMNESRENIISCPGQARVDKGYFRILDIAKSVEHFYGNDKRSMFVMQSMNPTDKHFNQSYEESLIKQGNINLRAVRLSQAEINQIYSNSRVILLPYDSDVYQYRGSAIFQECLSIGRPIVASKGLGFSDLIERYRCGYTCSTNEEFSDAICFILNKDKRDIMEDADRSRLLYMRDFNAGVQRLQFYLRG